jgi:hypothetical protein
MFLADICRLSKPSLFTELKTWQKGSSCIIVFTSRLLEQGAIDHLPAFVPKCYANLGPTLALVIKKMPILSPVIARFILAEKRLFEVDARKAGAVATMLQSKAYDKLLK